MAANRILIYESARRLYFATAEQLLRRIVADSTHAAFVAGRAPHHRPTTARCC